MTESAPPEFNPETAPPQLAIDWDAYLPFFEDEDIPEDQKRELIEALWGIMVSFVDLGFGSHPTQRACGQDISLAEALPVNVIRSDHTQTEWKQDAQPSERADRDEERSR